MRVKGFKLNRIVGTLVFICAIVASQLSGIQLAHAATTDVWTGAAGDSKLATAGNWQSSTTPVTGDILSFPTVSGGAALSLTNNLGTGVSLGGVIVNGANNTTLTTYTIDTLQFATGAAITTVGSDTGLVVSGAVSSAGSLSITGSTGAALTFSGTVTTTGDLTASGSNIVFAGKLTVGGNAVLTGTFINNNVSFTINGALDITGNLMLAGFNINIGNSVTVGGNLIVTASISNPQVYTVSGTVTVGDATDYAYLALSTGSAITGIVTVVKGMFSQASGATITLGGLTVDNGASAILDGTPSYPMTFGSGASAAYPSLVYNTGTWNSQTSSYDYNDLKISSAITLLNNLSISTSGNATSGSVSFTGAVTYNGFTISKYLGSSGKLFVGGTEIKNAPVTTSYTGNLPQTSFTVAESETATLSGTRSDATVFTGGILKGTGTLTSTLSVDYGGTVSPGNSPGMLTVLQTLTLQPGSIYQAEILNSTSYDQLQVGAQYTGSGNAVTLGTGTNLPTLNLTLLPGYVIKKGDSFKIIDNKSSTAVKGTFAGLSEGTQFIVSGITFNITYVGGDGNDIIVTALSAGVGSNLKTPNTSVAETLSTNPLAVIVLGTVTTGFFGLMAVRRRSNR